MSTDIRDRAATERRLWDAIQRHQTGMLGVVGAQPHHLQPMTAFAEPETGQIWFFTRNDTDLARQAGGGHAAMFVYQGKDLQACLGGELSVQREPARMEKYWNAVVSAWHPQGRADPSLTLLRFECHDAEVWISEAGPMKFAWEIAKANARHRLPDVGGHAHLNFH